MQGASNGRSVNTAVLVALVAVLFIGAAVATIVSLAGLDAQSTPAIATVLGLIGVAVAQLLTHLKVDRIQARLDGVEQGQAQLPAALVEGAIQAEVKAQQESDARRNP